MTLVVKNQNTPNITVAHNPDGGATLYTNPVIILDKEDAQRLGRYLLFQDDSDPSTPPEPNTDGVEGEDTGPMIHPEAP